MDLRGARPVLIIDGEMDDRRSPGDRALLAKRLHSISARDRKSVSGVANRMTKMSSQTSTVSGCVSGRKPISAEHSSGRARTARHP
jgi:hypothetical protein